MRLSTKGRYALEALVMLGYMNGESNNVSIKSVSNDTNISEKYLEQLFTLLRRGSIVVSKKGKNGGYHLAKPACDITVGDVFRAVEGSLTPVKCLDKVYCSRTNKCISRNLWGRIYEKMNDVIDNISLEDLIAQYKNRLDGESA